VAPLEKKNAIVTLTNKSRRCEQHMKNCDLKKKVFARKMNQFENKKINLTVLISEQRFRGMALLKSVARNGRNFYLKDSSEISRSKFE